MKVHKTQIIVDGRLVANVEIRDVHEKYFRLDLVFPNGNVKTAFCSYKSLEEAQDWDGQLSKQLAVKKGG